MVAVARQHDRVRAKIGELAASRAFKKTERISALYPPKGRMQGNSLSTGNCYPTSGQELLVDSIDLTVVPETATWIMLAIGGWVLIALRRCESRRRRPPVS